MSKLPVAVGLTQAKQTYPGHPVHVTVTDIGADPVRITTRTVVLGRECAESAARGVKVTPNVFQMVPGGHRTVTVSVPASPADYGVVFGAEPPGAHGIHEGTGLGAQILTGHAVSCVRVHHAAVAQSAGGFPLLWVVVGLIALVLAVVGTAMWRRRRA